MCLEPAAAAYARSPRELLASGRSSLKPMRRNLAPILGDGGFPCCAFSLRRASSHNLMSQDRLALDKAAAPGSLNAMPLPRHVRAFVPSARATATICLGLALLLGLATQGEAQGAAPDAGSEAAPAATGPGSVVRETHGAWQVSCRTPPGRQGREMRAGAKRHRRGQAECRTDRGVL
jgi:hypothetical protein